MPIGRNGRDTILANPAWRTMDPEWGFLASPWDWRDSDRVIAAQSLVRCICTGSHWSVPRSLHQHRTDPEPRALRKSPSTRGIQHRRLIDYVTDYWKRVSVAVDCLTSSILLRIPSAIPLDWIYVIVVMILMILSISTEHRRPSQL